MLSTIAIKNLQTMARRSAPMVVRPLSVATMAKVMDLEATLHKLHWHSTEDNVKEIVQLMDECKTNHAVRIPDDKLESLVRARLGDIRTQLTTTIHDPSDARQAIDTEIFGLKQMVRSQVYGI